MGFSEDGTDHGMTDVEIRKIAELEVKLKMQMRRATDAEYMCNAYMQMLGPKGLEVAEMWSKKGVRRVHHSWGPDAHKMTGEERAQFILDVEKAPKTPLDFDDGKGPRTSRPSVPIAEFLANLDKPESDVSTAETVHPQEPSSKPDQL